jgi:hypothetical protein
MQRAGCYDASVRTTLTLDADLAHALKEKARKQRRPFKGVVNDTLRAGLAAGQPVARRYRLKPVAAGGVVPGIDIDKALRLAEALEDEAIARKLEHRK